MPELTPIILDRALGSIVGLAIGDALGTSLEGAQRADSSTTRDMVGGGPHHLAPGQWTDDTAMALCLIDSLIAKRGRVHPGDLMQRFSDWMEQGHNSCTGTAFDVGVTTRGSISQYQSTGRALAGLMGGDSAGNGGIMRLAPVVVASLHSEAVAVRAAVKQSQTTHGAPECLEAAELLAHILHRLINAMPDARRPNLQDANRYTEQKVAHLAAGHYRTKDRDEIRSTGYVIDMLGTALWACSNHDSFEAAVTEAVNFGGDADTVGAVTGQIAGATLGLSAIPARWLDALAWRDDIEARTRRLLEVTTLPAGGSTFDRFRRSLLGR